MAVQLQTGHIKIYNVYEILDLVQPQLRYYYAQRTQKILADFNLAVSASTA